MNDSKSPVKSKIIITNGVVALAAVAMAAGLDLGLDPATQTQLVGGLMVAVNVVTIILRRYLTSKRLV